MRCRPGMTLSRPSACNDEPTESLRGWQLEMQLAQMLLPQAGPQEAMVCVHFPAHVKPMTTSLQRRAARSSGYMSWRFRRAMSSRPRPSGLSSGAPRRTYESSVTCALWCKGRSLASTSMRRASASGQRDIQVHVP